MNKIEDNLKEIKRKAKLLNEVYESFLNTDIIKLAEQTQSLVKNNAVLPVVRLSLPTILQLFKNAKTMNYKDYSDWVKRRLGYEA